MPGVIDTPNAIVRSCELDDVLEGTGSPDGLVAKILKAEPVIRYPIAIENIAGQFDIKEIADLETAVFEGGLLMDGAKKSGVILLNKAAQARPTTFHHWPRVRHALSPRRIVDKYILRLVYDER